MASIAKRTHSRAWLLGVLVGSLPFAPVWAGNTDFLKESAVGHFSREDVALMEKTLQDALSNAADGQTVVWRNDRTGSGGRITPDKAPVGQEGCRRVRVENFHDKRQGSDEYVLCKDGGRWVIPAAKTAKGK